MVTRCRYKQFFKMKLEDVLVMIGLKLLVMGYLKKYFTLHHPPPPTPFKNSEKSVNTRALIYLSIAVIPFIY